MHGPGFDTLAKSVAHPPSRRQLIRVLGGGGLAALALRGEGPTAAQGTPCTLTFTGTVRVGPSAAQPITTGGQPGVLQGELTFTPDPQGGISQGQLALTNGPTVPVVGQATGRAIHLRMTVNKQLMVVAIGTAVQDLMTCTGSVDGLLTGPQPGDLGDWHATASGSGASQPPGTGTTSGATGAATQPGAAGNAVAPTMTPAATQPTATASATATTDPTATVAATAPPTCPECQQPGTGGCVPVTDNTTCSAGRCCVGVCVDQATDPNNCGSCNNACEGGSCADGSCSPCSSTQRLCSGLCVDLMTDSANCGACGNACPSHTCANGQCQPCPPNLTDCGGSCVDLTADAANCGACGNVCPSSNCVGGQCQTCGAGYTDCGGTCSNVAFDPKNCGACGNACPSGQICFGGNCATDHR